MSPRTATLPPTEPAMWRKLLSKVHPDAAGDHELFIWAMNLREVVCDGQGYSAPPPPKEDKSPPPRPKKGPPKEEPDSVPFESSYDFDRLTLHALRIVDEVPEPYAGLLMLLKNCEGVDDGPLADQQRCGASYRQLAAIGHSIGMSKEERIQWYGIAESIPLSRRHAGHILGKLKGAA